ncbi:hypothetical protein K469DRAFT_719540 [Zopfia rhizophila CBS 207.26]|uniref:Cupin 2 conserved barrel domain-containing protein n=1 Tax=Zopfia rhizophila CBS 207.26 TaxID=1314779 RepID=A0A6A6DH52_9PEZI|nr:hypothetical protein K469DRAFT_719540 [Zopfia rhizophila CBS 207.26]
MVRAEQLWLSPRPVRRTNIADKAQILSAGDAALFEFLTAEDGRWFVRETHYIDNPLVKAGLSGPPLHIHFLQSEFFEVQQGTLGVVKNGKEHVITKADGKVTIPRGTRHRFWAHPSGTEDLIFNVWTEPQEIDHSFDINFLRNFIGYLADCTRQNIKPSFFQVVLICYDAGTVLTPGFWVPLWFLKLLHYVAAYWVAVGILGYKASYPEYVGVPNGAHRELDKSD